MFCWITWFCLKVAKTAFLERVAGVFRFFTKNSYFFISSPVSYLSQGNLEPAGATILPQSHCSLIPEPYPLCGDPTQLKRTPAVVLQGCCRLFPWSLASWLLHHAPESPKPHQHHRQPCQLGNPTNAGTPGETTRDTNPQSFGTDDHLKNTATVSTSATAGRPYGLF